MRTKLTLADYPADMVWIECNKCGRSGRLNKARLIAEHGGDTSLADLRGRRQPFRGNAMCKAATIARACLAGFGLVILSASFAEAYGPRTKIRTNYQQTSTITSTNGSH